MRGAGRGDRAGFGAGQAHDVSDGAGEAYVDTWQNPFIKDPFRIPLESQLELLLAADTRNAPRQGRHLAESSMEFRGIEQWYASTHRLAQSIRSK